MFEVDVAADRAGPGRALGLAVGVGDQRIGHPRLDLADDIEIERRRAVRHVVDPAQQFGRRARRLEDVEHHGRDERKPGHADVLDHVDGDLGVPLAGQDDGRAQVERRASSA
jgi:hypothetical protein